MAVRNVQMTTAALVSSTALGTFGSGGYAWRSLGERKVRTRQRKIAKMSRRANRAH